MLKISFRSCCIFFSPFHKTLFSFSIFSVLDAIYVLVQRKKLTPAVFAEETVHRVRFRCINGKWLQCLCVRQRVAVVSYLIYSSNVFAFIVDLFHWKQKIKENEKKKILLLKWEQRNRNREAQNHLVKNCDKQKPFSIRFVFIYIFFCFLSL